MIGTSSGYSMYSRIAAVFGSGAATIGVCFEKTATEKKTSTASWYNSAAFEGYEAEAGLYANSINGDTFSNEAGDQVI